VYTPRGLLALLAGQKKGLRRDWALTGLILVANSSGKPIAEPPAGLLALLAGHKKVVDAPRES
jgi:hypothetical protein